MKATETTPQPNLKENERKWTKPLMDAGYTVVPAVFLDRQRALDLDPIDMNILLQLITHWWKADNLPFPSKKAIAERINKTEKTVQRRIAKLEKAGFVVRKSRFSAAKGQLSNFYDFSGLIAAATPFAEEALQRRKQLKAEAKERPTRKRPKLHVVKGGEGGSE